MIFDVEVNEQFLHVSFDSPVRMLSSAILNGGIQLADHFLNTKVDANFKGEKTEFEAPDLTLKRIVDSEKWSGKCVGMMTAALMTSFRRFRLEKQGVWVEVLVTSGVSNARRAGDRADYQYMNEACHKVGTINILVLTNAKLSDASLVECIMMVAEAKSACLQDLNVLSPIACGNGPDVEYCGKHVLFGEILAKATYQALTDSLSVDK